MIPFLWRIAILLLVTLAYAVFDVFNRRNVPDVFVYAILVIALLVTFTYSVRTMEISLAVAAIIMAAGYVLYRKGIMGAGDFLEFATISLLLPIQPSPILSGLPQFNFPFIFSVFIATGYAAVIGMVSYYLFRACRMGYVRGSKIERRKLYEGIGIFVAYLLLLAFLTYLTGVRIVTIALVLIIGVASALTIMFDKPINRQMVSYIYPSKLTPEDMLATNFMSKSDMGFFEKKSKHFGRLVTKELIRDVKDVKRKIPVYTSGVPLALFAFIAVVVSLLFGNLLLYVII